MVSVYVRSEHLRLDLSLLIKMIPVGLILLACTNPLGEDNSIDSSFSPGGDLTAPEPPTNLSFTGAVTFTESPTLTWTSGSDNQGISHYEIGVGNISGSDNVVSFTDVGQVTSYQFTGVNPQLNITTNYYFVIKAVDTNGNESDIVSSSVWSPGLDTDSGAYLLPAAPFYFSTCNDYLSSSYYNAEGDGQYWIDLDGPGGLSEFITSCDMTSDSGGWTLVLNYVHQGATNPNTNIRGISLPRITSSTLGQDESLVANSWGHASNALLLQVPFTEIRFYCESSGHGRVMDFRTSHAASITYLTTGTGTMSGVASSFSAIAGHTSNLPATMDNQFTNEGDDALTNFPMIEGGVAHWGVRGAGGRWECDDNPGDDSLDTIHRVWVR